MSHFFDEESSRSSGSSTTTTTHPHSVGTPSPLSPSGCGSLVSSDSSVCPSLKSSPTSPESDGSSKQMYSSVVSKSCIMHGSSPSSMSGLTQGCEQQVSIATSPIISCSSSASVSPASSPQSSSVGQRIHDMVQNFQAGLLEKASGVSVSSPSPSVQPAEPTVPHNIAHRPSDLRTSPERNKAMVRATICDFRKYEINDPSKRNKAYDHGSDLYMRRENVVSWPPRKTPPLSPVSSVSHGQYSSSGWETVTSPLHMVEEKMLDDIPEESGDEWDSLCVRSAQERQHQSQSLDQCGREGGKWGRGSSTSSPRTSATGLKRCKSESSLCEKPQQLSLYDEMMTGSWDSGKMLERSASISEVRRLLHGYRTVPKNCNVESKLVIWLHSL